MEHLNEFSQRVYDFLSSNSSRHIERISILPCESFRGNFMHFEIEPPNKKASYGLTFDTDNNQITICFDTCHCHYYNYKELDFYSEMKRSIATIEEVMADQLLSVSYYSDGRLVMSGMKNKSYIDNLEESSPELLKYKIDRIVAVSWTGDFDRERIFNKKSIVDSTLLKVGWKWWQKYMVHSNHKD